MKNYLFITNSRRPTKEVYESKDPIILKNDSIPCVEAAQKLGYKVYMGVNRKYASELKCMGYDIEFYNADIYSSIFDLKTNFIAFKRLCKFIKEKRINVIHCNSPIGGFLGRVCGYICKVEKVIYTAHGFHFFKGAPFYNNLIFKSIEKILARITDVIITINEEDFKIAKSFKLKNNGQIYKVNGVGINILNPDQINNQNSKLLNELKLSKDTFIITTVGDLNKNKNFETIIKAISKLRNTNVILLICGVGKERRNLYKTSVKYRVENRVHFLGFRNDIPDILSISNLFILASYREGLPRSTMEAMSFGIPCIVSNIRGNVDLITNGENGFTFDPFDASELATKIKLLEENSHTSKLFSEKSYIKVSNFSIEVVRKQIIDLYEENLK